MRSAPDFSLIKTHRRHRTISRKQQDYAILCAGRYLSHLTTLSMMVSMAVGYASRAGLVIFLASLIQWRVTDVPWGHYWLSKLIFYSLCELDPSSPLPKSDIATRHTQNLQLFGGKTKCHQGENIIGRLGCCRRRRLTPIRYDL